MSAEKHYSPFSGFGGRPAGGASSHHHQQHHGGGGGRPAGGGGALGSRLQAVDWEKAKLAPSEWKVFDAKAVAASADRKLGAAAKAAAAPLTDEEAAAWREKNSITTAAPDCPPPMPTFEGLRGVVPDAMLQRFAAEGFTAPTGIQSQAWPILLAGRDCVGIAKTGSGKTLAFVVPAVAHILRHGLAALTPADPGPVVVVLAPTRELAQQIEVEARKVLPQELRCACIYGGAPKGLQLQQLGSTGVHILVATPGRLIDMLEIRRIRLTRTTFVVLDEADRMLDMGFEPQVRAICGQIRPDRQMLMFSATWPREIQALAAAFQRNFIRINVGSTELVANPDVEQRFVLTQECDKFEELKKIMVANKNRRVLVFCKTKRTADQLEWQLKRCGYDAMAIHGDKEQRQREFILERFRRDSRLCLVATDVAARGLDIKQLEVVVNFDFPMQIDDYVHRVGRTGRAGAKGESITFITKKEEALATNAALQTLVGIVEGAKQVVPDWMKAWAEQAGYKVLKRGRDGAGSFGAFSRHPAGGALHYAHGNKPSFDAGNAAAGAPKQFFGLAPRGGGAAAGGGGAGALPSFQSNAQYTKFDSDDDDDVPRADPLKKARTTQ